jgi:hypothetical protein
MLSLVSERGKISFQDSNKTSHLDLGIISPWKET